MFRFSKRFRHSVGVLALAATAGGAAGCASMVSTQQEVQLGNQYAAQINRELPIVQDAAIHRYINQLGNSIARQVDQRNISYQFHVVNSNEVNAFAIPGGHIYVNRGLIDRADNLSELAGVLGHEIGHVVERHGVEQMARMQQAELGANLAYVLLGRQPGQIEQTGLQLAGGAYFASHGREAEREADRQAVQYLVQTGINPRGIPSFFRKLLNQRQSNPGTLEQWFSTHPLTEERIADTQAAIAALPASRLQGLTTDTQTFQQFQARVRRLPAAPQQRR